MGKQDYENDELETMDEFEDAQNELDDVADDLEDESNPEIEDTDESDGDEDIEPEEEEENESRGKVKQTKRDVKNQPVFTKDDVSKIVSRRVNSKNARIKALEEENEILDEICEITGLTRAQLRQKFSSMSDQEKAQIMGITPEQVSLRNLISRRDRELKRKEAELKLKDEITALKSDKRYSDFDEYEDDIKDTLERYPHMSVKEAYKFVKANLYDDEDTQKLIEQRIIEQKASKSSKKVVTGGGVAKTNKAPQLSPKELRVASLMGLTPAEYMKYQNIYSLDQNNKRKKEK